MTTHPITGIPRELPAGRALVHNGVQPQRRIGTNGFRAWTQDVSDDLIQCHCDWAGVDLHGIDHYLPMAWIDRLNDERLAAMGIERPPVDLA
jgi:hypothetical protein